MTSNKEKIIIRPEKLSEYEKVDKLIYKAFAEQHSIETEKFMTFLIYFHTLSEKILLKYYLCYFLV